jgi:uncharacterized protein
VNGPSRRERQASAPAEAGQSKASRCPICGKPTSQDHRPFCSRRCADIDLGRWLKGGYAVPGERMDQNKDEADD